MLIVLSPAKTLDYESPIGNLPHSQPSFLKESEQLIKRLKKISVADLSQLMKISENLAQLNVKRYKQWQTPFTKSNARQAILAFKGDVYQGLQAETMTTKQLEIAQQKLRILSGLYGVLKPMDLMYPYRLEMGTGLDTNKGKDLYEFWGNQVTESLNAELNRVKNPCLINLASNEYFKVIKPKLLSAPVITPVFKDLKNDSYKVISFYAKKARGMMAAYAIKKRLSQPEALKKFNTEGYQFNPDLSDNSQWVFTRDQVSQ